MQIDIAILIVILLFTIVGFKNGFMYTLTQTLGWVVSFVAAFFLYKKLAAFLINQTNLYDNYVIRIAEVCQDFITKLTGGVTGSVPGKFGEALDTIGEDVAAESAYQIAASTFNVLVFLLIAFVVKLILFFLMRLLSKRYRNGFVGGFDAAFGILIGLVQGAVVVFVLLLFLMPVAFLIGPGVFTAIQGMMDKSFFAEMLYLNNPLIMLIDGYMPSVLSPDKWLPDKSNYEFSMKDWDNLK